MKKDLPVELLEKLFKIKVEYETMRRFVGILQQSLLLVQQEINKIELKKQNIKDFTDVPLDKELVFDFKDVSVSWEEDGS